MSTINFFVFSNLAKNLKIKLSKQGLMLSFPSQNDNFFSDRLGLLEKINPGDGKPTYF